MMTADLVSLAAFASVPVAAALGGLTMAQLLLVALVSGAAAVFFTTAYRAFLPALLDSGGRQRGGGVIVDAASFAVSAACLSRIHVREPRPGGPRRRLRSEIAEGLAIGLKAGAAGVTLALASLGGDRGPGLALFLLGSILIAGGVVAGNVIWSGWVQDYYPADLLGRISTSVRIFNYGAVPAGAVIAGLTASQLGVRPTLWIMLAALVLSPCVLLFGLLPRLRDLPSP